MQAPKNVCVQNLCFRFLYFYWFNRCRDNLPSTKRRKNNVEASVYQEYKNNSILFAALWFLISRLKRSRMRQRYLIKSEENYKNSLNR